MMSSAFPWGTPSRMSIRATSASSFSTMRWATVAPTFPAPTTVTLCFIRRRIISNGYHSSMEDVRARRSLLAAIAILPLVVAAALWLPRWWEHREYREAEAIAGIAAPMAPGTLAEARPQLDPGTASDDVKARL